jgi:hypothetical protein
MRGRRLLGHEGQLQVIDDSIDRLEVRDESDDLSAL